MVMSGRTHWAILAPFCFALLLVFVPWSSFAESDLSQTQSTLIKKAKAQSAILADLDGDGDAELMTVPQGTVTFYVDNGSTGLSEVPVDLTFPAQAKGKQALTTADFDRDGDTDLLRCAEFQGGGKGMQCVFHFNCSKQGAPFQFNCDAAASAPISTAGNVRPFTFDFDRDNDADVILFPLAKTGTVRVFRNNLNKDTPGIVELPADAFPLIGVLHNVAILCSASDGNGTFGLTRNLVPEPYWRKVPWAREDDEGGLRLPIRW